MAVASSIPEEVKYLFLFCLPRLREVVPMYLTWETFFLFCSLLVAVIGLVYNICNNSKKR